MLTLRQMQTFQTVAETGNFTKTAQRLFLTQSAVSHTIKELEEYAGTLLFDRSSRKVQLTSAGKHLLEDIIPILSACEDLDKRIKVLEEQTPIHIVSSITIAAFWLPAILKKFQNEREDVPVYVEVVSAAEAIRILKEGKADLAFMEGARPQGPFTEMIFDHYNLMIVAAPGTTKTQMTVPEFCAQKLLLREKGSAIRDTLDSVLLLKGYQVHPMWTSVNSMALVEATKAGLGVTVLPEVLVKKELEEKRFVSIKVENLELKNEMRMIWQKEKHVTASMEGLLQYFREEMEK